MFDKVVWEIILLVDTGGGGGSHRVARQDSSVKQVTPVSDEKPFSGEIYPPGDDWFLGPKTFPGSSFVWDERMGGDGRTYVRAFWSYVVRDAAGVVTGGHVVSGTEDKANDTVLNGPWTETVKCFYVWNFGEGGGDNAVLIDAFDKRTGEFIPDDFVGVKPDFHGVLAKAANDGYIDTDTQIKQGGKETITAGDIASPKPQFPGSKAPGPKYKFAYWESVDALLYSDDAKHPATVGEPDEREIIAHHHDIVSALAMYDLQADDGDTGSTSEPPPNATFDPWWWWRTHGGLVPPYPSGPLFDRGGIEIVNSLLLYEAVRGLEGDLQARGLELLADDLEQKALLARRQADMRRRDARRS